MQRNAHGTCSFFSFPHLFLQIFMTSCSAQLAMPRQAQAHVMRMNCATGAEFTGAGRRHVPQASRKHNGSEPYYTQHSSNALLRCQKQETCTRSFTIMHLCPAQAQGGVRYPANGFPKEWVPEGGGITCTKKSRHRDTAHKATSTANEGEKREASVRMMPPAIEGTPHTKPAVRSLGPAGGEATAGSKGHMSRADPTQTMVPLGVSSTAGHGAKLEPGV